MASGCNWCYVVSTQIRRNNPEETVLYQKTNGWRFNENNGALATKDFSIAQWYYVIAFKCHVFGKERNIFWMVERELDRPCSDGGSAQTTPSSAIGTPDPWLSSLSSRSCSSGMNLQSRPSLVQRADTANICHKTCPPECPKWGVLDRRDIQSCGELRYF